MSRSRWAIALISLSGALLVLAFSVPAHTVGYLGFGMGLVSVLPQLRETLTGRSATGETGVSITTYFI